MTDSDKNLGELPEMPERRELLVKAGCYAAATPAAVVVLLSTAKEAEATGIFRSGGGRHRGQTYRRWNRQWNLRQRQIQRLRKIARRRGWDS